MKFHFCVFSMITCAIPYMVLVMCTAHVHSANILSGTHPELIKNASFMPKLINGKWPVSLGQLEGQLKKVVGTFPITAAQSRINAPFTV